MRSGCRRFRFMIHEATTHLLFYICFLHLEHVAWLSGLFAPECSGYKGPLANLGLHTLQTQTAHGILCTTLRLGCLRFANCTHGGVTKQAHSVRIVALPGQEKNKAAIRMGVGLEGAGRGYIQCVLRTAETRRKHVIIRFSAQHVQRASIFSAIQKLLQ